jgi:hypothetical protein
MIIRTLTPFIIFFLTIVISGCHKNQTASRPINCDNLINDSLSPADSGRIVLFNTFTPNGDIVNDRFIIPAYHIASMQCTIYDINNSVVFSGNNTYNWIPPLPSTGFTKYFIRVEAITNFNKRISRCGDIYVMKCIPAGFDPSIITANDPIAQDNGIKLCN